MVGACVASSSATRTPQVEVEYWHPTNILRPTTAMGACLGYYPHTATTSFLPAGQKTQGPTAKRLQNAHPKGRLEAHQGVVGRLGQTREELHRTLPSIPPQ